jgi:hypothetical protein
MGSEEARERASAFDNPLDLGLKNRVIRSGVQTRKPKLRNGKSHPTRISHSVIHHDSTVVGEEVIRGRYRNHRPALIDRPGSGIRRVPL